MFGVWPLRILIRSVAKLVAASARAILLPHETDREASFSAYKPNNPAFLYQPFLLVFRTVQIVTAQTLG
jgi:hypothetical protein